jgi:hypothetical protein
MAKDTASSEVEDAMSRQSGSSDDGYVPGTEEEKKLIRKIDLMLMPTIWCMYLLSYMDRTK